jgi:hypothetical protein
MFRNLKKGNNSNKFITLAMLIFLGFGLLPGPFKGNVWPHYYELYAYRDPLCDSCSNQIYFKRVLYVYTSNHYC